MVGTVRGTQRLSDALRSAADAGTPLRAIGAANALAARAGADAGFDALWISGLEVSTGLGLPDENVLGPSDLAAVVTAVRRVVDLPIIVDIDNAGGGTATAQRVAADLARAGADGLCLEDSRYPKINSFATHRDQHLADEEQVCAQLEQMRAAAPELVLIARTETLICGGSVPEAIERVSSYVEAGADAVLMHSKDSSGKQALASAAGWQQSGTEPLVSIPTAFPQLSAQELAAAGFTLVIYANQLARASFAAMQAAARGYMQSGEFTLGGAALPSVQDLLQVADPNAKAVV